MFRRLLSRRVSVEAMIEFALLMAIPYLVIGILWAFFNIEQVERFETYWDRLIPAGSEEVALVEGALFWPVFLVGADLPHDGE